MCKIKQQQKTVLWDLNPAFFPCQYRINKHTAILIVKLKKCLSKLFLTMRQIYSKKNDWDCSSFEVMNTVLLSSLMSVSYVQITFKTRFLFLWCFRIRIIECKRIEGQWSKCKTIVNFMISFLQNTHTDVI